VQLLKFDEERSKDFDNGKIMSLVKKLIEARMAKRIYHNKQQNSYIYKLCYPKNKI